MRRVGSALVVAAMIAITCGTAGPARGAPITPSPFDKATRSIGAGYVPVAGDFDGDGRTDVFWYHPGPGADYVWWGTPTASTFGSLHDEFVVNGTYRPVAGDFDGDGRTDIAWLSTRSSGTLALWFARANRTFSSESINFPVAAGVQFLAGDFNGDGKDDLFGYSPGGVHVVAYGTNDLGTLFRTVVAVPLVLGEYAPIAADYNGDGRTDIYWAAKHGGSSYLWVTHAGRKFTSWIYQSVAPPTSFAGEFTGDANADLFAYGPGAFAERIFNGGHTNIAPIGFDTIVVPNVVGTYTPVVGKFAGGTKADIIWYTGNGAPSPYWISR